MYKSATQGTMGSITAAGNKKMKLVVLIILISVNVLAQTQPLKISANKRYFQTPDGKPFFWLGDTGWLLFVKYNREETLHYLETRKRQGFNVVQAMVLHDMNNTNGENSVMQFNNKSDWTANFGVRNNWKEALLSEGATHMQHLKKLQPS